MLNTVRIKNLFSADTKLWLYVQFILSIFLGTTNVVFKSRQWNVSKLVITSTVDAVFQKDSVFLNQRESQTELPVKEEKILMGYYGFTKAQSEAIVLCSKSLPLANGKIRLSILELYSNSINNSLHDTRCLIAHWTFQEIDSRPPYWDQPCCTENWTRTTFQPLWELQNPVMDTWLSQRSFNENPFYNLLMQVYSLKILNSHELSMPNVYLGIFSWLFRKRSLGSCPGRMET